MKSTSKKHLLFLFIITFICSIITLPYLQVNSHALPGQPIIIQENSSRQWNVKVASNGTGYLCIWDNNNDILGRLIDLDGEIQGNLLNLTQAFYGGQIEPDLVTDGEKYLVVWSEWRNFAATNYDIYGCFVYSNGTFSNSFTIDTSEGRQRFPKVRYNGQHYLVVWEDWAGFQADQQVQLKYKRLDSSGNLIDIGPKKIATAISESAEKSCFDLCSFEDPDKPDVSWFITWSGLLKNERHEILGGFLKDNVSELLLNQEIQIITPNLNKYYLSHLNPSVDCIGNIILVVWESWKDELGSTDIYGRRLQADIMDSECVQISAKEEQEKYPQVASNGQVFFLIWKELENGNIFGKRISKEGLLLNDYPPTSDNVIINEADPNINHIYHLSVAANGLNDNSQYFCAWSNSEQISDDPIEYNWSINGHLYSPPSPPELIWLGTGSYTEDGINPNSGPGGSLFIFKVKYSSLSSLIPNTAQIWIDLDDNGRYELTEKFDMTAETDNITYAYSKDKIHYDGDGILTYRFFFIDDYNTAIGEPTQDKTFVVNKVGFQPELYWTEEPGFTGDGARPDGAEWSTESTNFEFRVLYKDEDGDAPINKYLCIDKDRDGSFEQNERFVMNALGSNYQTGVIYCYTPLPLNLEIINPINYKFDFDDGKNKGIGEPRIANYISIHPIGETAACLNNHNQFFPAITLTNLSYQVFWEDQREINGGVSHIWMELLTKNGRVMDNAGESGQIKLDTSTMGAFKPKGLFDTETQTTLVIWEDLRNGTILEQASGNNIFKPQAIYQGLDIYGRFVNSNGNPIINEFRIAGSTTTQNVLNADMALGLNGQYLVVWEDEKNIETEEKTNLYARFVKYQSNPPGSTLGAIIDLEEDPNDDKHQLLPRVAWNGKFYLAVWQDVADADPNSGYYNSRIYGKRIDPNGESYPGNSYEFFNDNIEMTLSDPNINQLFPDVASDGENFLIVWQDSRSLGTKKGYNIYGMRVNINGMAIQYLNIPDWEIPICTANGHQIKPRVFWDPQGKQFLIMWLEVPEEFDLFPIDMFSLASPVPGDIKFIRMDPNGILLDATSTKSPSSNPGISPIATASTQNLFDTHCDQISGCRMIWEDLRSDATYDLYSAELQSILRWVDDPNFIYGINPLTAFESNLFTFKIEYCGWNKNLAPKVSQVWIDLNDNGTFGEDEKFNMELLSDSPMVYTFKKEIYSPENEESDDFIGYRFYFEDQTDAVAGGIGSNLNYFLLVPGPENNAVLEWVSSDGFITDGIDPDQAYEGTNFNFSVSYRDPLNNPPIIPQVWIDENDDGKYDDTEKFGMQEDDKTDTIFSDGKVYTLGLNLFYPSQGDGNISYRFFFTYQPPTPDKYKPYFPDLLTIKVEGEPTSDHPISLQGALLEWAGSGGFSTDGVDPDQADEGTNFNFSVSYKDQLNTPPTTTQVWIDKNDNGDYEENEKFNMNENYPGDINFTNGKLYSFEKTLFLAENGDINYRFAFTYDPFNDANNPYVIFVKGEPAINHTVLVNSVYDRQIMDLTEGWNIVSLPCRPPSSVVSEIFPDAKVIYAFNKYLGYVRVMENQELQTTEGYWILLDQDQEYSLITEHVINEYTYLSVKNGWYMIGSCTYDAKATVTKGNIAVIYSFIPGMGYQEILDTENIEPGKGYWILLEGIPDNEYAELTIEEIN